MLTSSRGGAGAPLLTLTGPFTPGFSIWVLPYMRNNRLNVLVRNSCFYSAKTHLFDQPLDSSIFKQIFKFSHIHYFICCHMVSRNILVFKGTQR